MYTVYMASPGIGFSMAYTKGTSLDEAVENGIAKLFPGNKLLSLLRQLPMGSDNAKDVEDAVAPFSSDFNVAAIDDNRSVFMYSSDFTNIIALEIARFPEKGDSFLHKPTKTIPVVTTANLKGKNVFLFVRPRCVKELGEMANLFFDKDVNEGKATYKTKLDVLVRLGAVYKGLVNSKLFMPKFDKLDAYNRVDVIAKMAKARYGKDFDFNGISPFIAYHSVYPLRFRIDSDTDPNAIRALFYFCQLLLKHVDTDQILYNEFGIHPATNRS